MSAKVKGNILQGTCLRNLLPTHISKVLEMIIICENSIVNVNERTRKTWKFKNLEGKRIC